MIINNDIINLSLNCEMLKAKFKESIVEIPEEDLAWALESEKIDRNRIDVIKLLRKTLRMKQLGAEHI